MTNAELRLFSCGSALRLTSFGPSVTLPPAFGAKHSLRVLRAQEFHGEATAAAAQVN
jgi:hypothetical protein